MLYFDYAATTPLNNEVYETYTKLIKEKFANPDSIHGLGAETETLMEKSRKLISNLLRVKANEVIFTSGASESNNFAIKGAAFAYQNRGKHLITTTCEHSSVYETFQQLETIFGFEVTYIDVDSKGNLDLKMLEASIRKETILISIMHTNNEVGFINPIRDVIKIVKNLNPLTKIHVDMVQSLGKIDLDFENIDLASLSAHKIYGLKGSGLLIKKDNCQLVPLLSGGQQEFGLRGGTSNVFTNIVFAKTLRLALSNLDQNLIHVSKLNKKIRDTLESQEGIVINTPSNGNPYILNISFIGYKPEVFVHELETMGVYVSTRSACSSKSESMSRTLKMMRVLPEVGESAIRISLSHLTTDNDVDMLLDAINKTKNKLKKQR